MQIVGRKNEIKNLEWDLQKSESQFVAVYGRRRIGKTYLVREMFADRFTFAHTGLRGGDKKAQLEAFRSSLVRYGRAKCPVLKSWLQAFEELDKLIAIAPPGRKVIFIDELPWMDTPRSGLLVGLESFWNARASARAEKDVFLVVCGSASSWIVKNLLGDTGGLYGRLTDRIWLRPFTLAECEKYSDRIGLSLSRQELCEAYMIFGGVPYYWNLLRPDMSLAQNIDTLFFSGHGALRDEFGFLYASIFRNAGEHIAIVEALSKKKVGMTREEIASAAGQKMGGNFRLVTEVLVEKRENEIVMDVFGKGFMYKQVRSMVGLLLAVGEGRVKVEEVDALCSGTAKCRMTSVAPPQGLTLVKVYYSPGEFEARS